MNENNRQVDINGEPWEDIPIPTPAWVLNKGQQEALDWLVPFCLADTNGSTFAARRALLKGYAGTGKTFCINRVVEAVKKLAPNINFGMTAPTHKAVRQLKKHSELREELDFGTIHSFLGLKQYVDDNTGKVEYKPGYDSGERGRRIDGIHVLIVDEASMLDDPLFVHIDDELRSNSRLKLIFMGDPLQIPPVGKKQRTGESMSKPFMQSIQISYNIKVLELLEPQRQVADSPIILYAHNIRKQYDRQHILHTFPIDTSAIEITPRSVSRLKEVFKQYFCTDEFREDADYAKVVAWRNSTVHYFNTEIRLLINQAETLPQIIENDKLIMYKALVRNDKVVIPNNEEVLIEPGSLKLTKLSVQYSIVSAEKEDRELADIFSDVSKQHREVLLDTYECILVTPEGMMNKVFILHEDAQQEYDEIRGRLERAAKNAKDQFVRREMWKEFYHIESRFAWVTHNYCVTAHKAQGSTYDYCISMEWDIEQDRDIEERNRIRYVAATRARHKLFIVK